MEWKGRIVDRIAKGRRGAWEEFRHTNLNLLPASLTIRVQFCFLLSATIPISAVRSSYTNVRKKSSKYEYKNERQVENALRSILDFNTVNLGFITVNIDRTVNLFQGLP